MTTENTQTPTGPGPEHVRLAVLAGTSFWIGIGSILLGWTLVAPIAGLIVGVLALHREPVARRLATTGIVLNSLCLLVYALVLVVAVLNLAQRLSLHYLGGPL